MDLGPCFVSVCFHVHVYNEKQAQLGVVHGPGPQRCSMDRVHGVVHGPGPQGWSMDPGPCFVFVRSRIVIWHLGPQEIDTNLLMSALS